MVMKKDGRKRDIKSKLVAAVCMLLVSCIMMVSSTYAWFTLSTAPEVTGITTAVGANGNLEMALLPNGTTVADALKAITNSDGSITGPALNNTWGNLVNLSDSSYGLNNVTLYPSTLSGDGSLINADGILSIPKYGADGRVSDMGVANLNGIYANGAFGSGGYGVRVVGTSSGMSAQEQAYRTALSNGNIAANRAITAAKNSMSAGGSELATLAMKRAMNNSATYTKSELVALQTAFALLTNETDTGAFDYIEEALKQYILANYISTTTEFTTIAEQIEAADLSNLPSGVSIPSAVSSMITDLATAKGEVTAAQSGLKTLLDSKSDTDVIQWTDFNTYVSVLGSSDKMTLNGEKLSTWMADQSALLNSYTQLGGLFLVLTDGVYVDLANYCNTLEADVQIKNVEAGGLKMDTVNAHMTAEMDTTAVTTITGQSTEACMAFAKTTVSGKTFTGGGSAISDYYGYIIDMAFRTNVADSFLQLQTEAVDRIYADQDPNEYTTGHGSSMTFTASGDFDTDDLKNLMSFFRVVFFDTETNQIYAQARLDVDNAKVDGNSVTAELKLWNKLANDGEGGWATNNQIVALTQNQPIVISSLIYLDGVNMENKDIANAVLSGTMNLQFSSSATLTPMEYGELRNPSNAGAATEYTVTVNGMQASNKVTAGATYTANVNDYTQYIGENKTVTGVTVTMGGTEVPNAYDSTTGNVTVSNVSGDLVVTVTVTEAAGG